MLYPTTLSEKFTIANTIYFTIVSQEKSVDRLKKVGIKFLITMFIGFLVNGLIKNTYKLVFSTDLFPLIIIKLLCNEITKSIEIKQLGYLYFI